MDQLVNDGKIQGNWTPIMRSRQTFNVHTKGSTQICRIQYPIVPAEAITIHKSQGQTCDSIVVPGKAERCLLYVAFSRARTLDGPFINGDFHEPNPPSIQHPVTKEMQRLRTDFHLKPKFQHLRFPSQSIQFASFNVQSLRKHITSVRVDQVLLSCEVLLFQETCASSNLVANLSVTKQLKRHFATKT
ncbi:ATP-dependent DNA helicase [Trichonephila clavata]|uniref:ATP-dependent DNA helicase n=1 Tax=Trichonephila clavata TaxID=2740835 RepID=A0A8X6FSI8_TRICU|nr:ATP-dependent DNA helicase [Trichonephila clavata]